MKSSTMLIRDENEKIVGALCINFDLTSVNIAKNFLEDISFIEEKDSKEKFPENVDRFLEIMIEKAISIVNKPINILSKEDKVRIVRYLHKNNVFDIKGSVKIIANHLNISKYSIYNYLEEIRIDSRMQ
ncbi:YheO-like PAS domain-containing protein [Selenihalanaerobacter shriftii]|uniref:YheO-like PAS domain-containing protein n=1 Tax=Selenihalanaerobacter shriftii TaxID=142842 RepID=A0A1T4QNS0_9FIRM|nr:YheO-like PAS domain-containing protein [Selenihalanaerobacter shriftii]